MKTCGIPIERIHDGQPLIAPTQNAWESGHTINAAAVYLERSTKNDAIIRALLGRDNLEDVPDGIVAIHYRAIPGESTGAPIPFSSTGLAVFTPDLSQQLRRFDQPVLEHDPDANSFDYYGIEDPRITRIGDIFYMLYCGPRFDQARSFKTRLCLASSTDLIHWEKHGPIPGGPDRWENKDGVLFPEIIDGKVFLLHRPWSAPLAVSDFSIWLASSSSLFGPWDDYGEILHSYSIPGCAASWVGAGSVPIAIGENRFLVIYHTGNFLNDRDREYDMGAALFDFNAFTVEDPRSVVISRLEPLMVPETTYEQSNMPAAGRLDVLFPCGSYEYRGDIYIVYGASDRFTCAAKVNGQVLLDALEHASLANPYIT